MIVEQFLQKTKELSNQISLINKILINDDYRTFIEFKFDDKLQKFILGANCLRMNANSWQPELNYLSEAGDKYDELFDKFLNKVKADLNICLRKLEDNIKERQDKLFKINECISFHENK